MPIYEYQCEQCGVRFERLQHMTAEPVSLCPECGGHVHRVISGVGVIFRGSGFYVTDNRRSTSGVSRNANSGSKDTDKAQGVDPDGAESAATTSPSDDGDS